MILNVPKAVCFTVLFISLTKFSVAQSNYFKYSYGFGAGLNKSYTDVKRGSIGFTFNGVLDYNLTPFVTLGVEGQFGQIKGGDINTDPNNRQFTNQYISFSANARLMLGEVLFYDRSEFLYQIRGLYVGFGVGLIHNKITDIVRFKPSWAAIDPGYGPFPGKDQGINLLAPLNIGFNYFIMDGYGYQRYIINFNAQTNFTFGEGLDGYNDPSSRFRNNSPDVFNTYTIGFRYMLGTIKAYRKTL